MANELGQPTAQEIAEKFCTEMLCNALLCDGCPVQAIQHAAQQPRALDATPAGVADVNIQSGFAPVKRTVGRQHATISPSKN